MSQVGSVLLHVLSAWHVRVTVEESVYPVKQVNDATDP